LSEKNNAYIAFFFIFVSLLFQLSLDYQFLKKNIFVLFRETTNNLEENLGKEYEQKYFVVLDENLLDSAIALNVLSFLQNEQYKIERNGSLIQIGPFSDKIKAGYFRYKYFELTNYTNLRIFANKKFFVADNLNELLTVGMYKGKSALYKYDIIDRKRSLFWQHWNRRIIDIKYSYDLSKAFVLCSSKIGEINQFPYVFNLRLIFVDLNDNEVREIYKELDLLEAKIDWVNKAQLLLQYNKWDLKDSRKVNRNEIYFDLNGNKISEKRKAFDLLDQGYPKFINSKIYASFSERRIFYFESFQKKWIYLLDSNPIFVFEDSSEIYDCKWNQDESLMAFATTEKNSAKGEYKLFCYQEKYFKLSKIYRDTVEFSFELRGDVLLYDEGLGDESRIYVYNAYADSIQSVIKDKNGVALRNLRSKQKNIFY